jgi:RNA polymerase sigma-70 factor (ECF subfamily)
MSISDNSGFLSNSLTYSALVRLSDELVMSRLASGNHDALAVIFDRYQRVVIRVAMQILRDAAEAEDVMQSVFIAILESANKFSPERGTLRVWILQHAYHQALNRRRYLSLRGAYNVSDSDAEFRRISEWSRSLSAPESRRLVQQALNQLSKKQRETVELAFYDGLTMQEIAERTGQSYANTRHHYYRGLERLRLVLGYSAAVERRGSANGEETAYAQS